MLIYHTLTNGLNNNIHITCIRLNVAIHEVHSTSYESRTVTYPECIT